MKLSEFIASLNAIHVEHGDIEVHHDNIDVGHFPSETPVVQWVAKECAHLTFSNAFTEHWAREAAKQFGVENPTLIRIVMLHSVSHDPD